MDKKPQPWPPYARDCSQGYCSYYCPQWCFFFFPSPPPPPPSSSPLLSPLLIAVIAVTSTALVLITYYLILARYRARHRSSGPAPPPLDPAFGFLASRNEGLDDNLISMIKTYKYQAGGGLVVDGTDCSVCLSPFEDGDKIRLLSKCKHAFHQCCIDTWLKSHANCPLCRACIFPLQEGQESESESESEVGRVIVRIDPSSDQIIEIGEGRGVIGRSFSMDSPFRRQMGADTATDINSVRWSCRSLHSVISPMRMKRSRSMTSAVARGRSEILPT